MQILQATATSDEDNFARINARQMVSPDFCANRFWL